MAIEEMKDMRKTALELIGDVDPREWERGISVGDTIQDDVFFDEVMDYMGITEAEKEEYMAEYQCSEEEYRSHIGEELEVEIAFESI